MAVRRSKRIAELETNKNGNSLGVAQKRSKPSEELVKAEIETMKNELKAMERTLTMTKARLTAEQEKSLTLKVEVSKRQLGRSANRMYNELMKEKVDVQNKKIEEGKKKIEEMKEVVRNCKQEKAVNEEREKAKKYRDEYLAEVEKYTKEEEKKNEGPPRWKICEICAFPFGKEAPRVPRILTCGHTVCTECAENLKCQMTNSIRCPFDRQVMQIGGEGIQGLTKNLVILNL